MGKAYSLTANTMQAIAEARLGESVSVEVQHPAFSKIKAVTTYYIYDYCYLVDQNSSNCSSAV